MIEPVEQELTVYKGTDFEEVITFKSDGAAMDLTGYTVKCQVRDKQRQSGVLIVEFAAAVTDALAGEITLSLTDVQTAAIIAKKGYFTLVLIDPSDIDLPYVMGKVIFIDTATVKA